MPAPDQEDVKGHLLKLLLRFSETGRLRIQPVVTSWLLTALIICCSWSVSAQTSADPKSAPVPSPSPKTSSVEPLLGPVDLKSLPRNLFRDQKSFWSTPLHMSKAQWQWTVPIAFVGAGLLASDTAIEKHVPTNPTTVSHAVTVSNAGLAAFAGAGAGMFLWGHLTHNDERRETGLLSGEAAVDAFLEVEVFKYAAGRDRPFTGDGRGRFFQGGNSFPSNHAAMSWAIASVIAHEYPGPMTKLLVYGLAGGVSAVRVAGQKHFATDAVVGSALGWYIGRQVFRSHSHYSDADVARWGRFSKSQKADKALNPQKAGSSHSNADSSRWDKSNKGVDADMARDPGDMGSPYVPLDSWVYPAMERLIALGYVQSADLGMRPWTRMECARLLVEEAHERLQDSDTTDSQPEKIYSALTEEFSDETARLGGAANLGVDVDSIYTRIRDISGRPLHDGLHFGQTVINDYGRPYGEGFNNVTGVTGHAVAGPFSFFVRGEYQHAPSVPALSAQARQVIQAADGLPSAPPDTPVSAVNRLDLLEGYVGLQIKNWELSFGKQALWWGPDASGPMLFSNNAAPILMLQINRVKPFKLPSVLGVFGPIRLSYILGRTTGYNWVFSSISGFTGSWTASLSDQPFIVGEKVSFKPTTDLEFGFSATALAGGTGVPFNLHKLVQASFSSGNGNPGTSGDAGDRRGGFDFTYRIPKLRDWLTLYGDAFTEDQANPWLAWNKAALTSGIYMARIPRIPKLDLRVEGVYTDLPVGPPVVHLPGFFYFNSRFKSGYTNDGNLIGSWIGREGQGGAASTTYWLSPKDKVQFNFRHQKVSRQFIPGGGTLNDFGVSGDYWLRSNVGLSASVQYERWLFPVIQPNAASNVTATIQVLFKPPKLFRHAAAAPTTQP